MKNAILSIALLISATSVVHANCQNDAEQAMIRNYGAPTGYILQTNPQPASTLSLDSGKVFEIWTGYIANPDRSDEKGVVVQLNAATCKIVSVNSLQ